MTALLLVPFIYIFIVDNADFFARAAKEREQGYDWHYVGKSPPDVQAKSLTLQCADQNGKACGEPYILWKLKK
tara:strand:- start:164 stop:382 length:219 start_codon:yes stop_codon:yes gene_type:complete